MTDVFKELPRLAWRGIKVPVLERSVSFEQEYARHKYAYRDDEYLEALGRKNWRFEYTIPFREDITRGPYKHLYVETFAKFIQACRDNSVGDLVDPVLGVYYARCESVSIRTDINRRDGEDVQVVFVDSPPLDEADDAYFFSSSQAGAAKQARDLTTALSLETFALDANPKELADLARLKNGVDILDQIAGIGAMALSYVDRVDAAFANYEAKIDKIIGVLEDINERRLSPETMPLIRSVIRVKDAVQRTQFKSSTKGKIILSDNTTSDSTATILANFYKMTLDDFLLINSKVHTPLVPAGTTVFYFQREFV